MLFSRMNHIVTKIILTFDGASGQWVQVWKPKEKQDIVKII